MSLTIASARASFLFLHRWIGLLLGLVLVLIGLTGSILSFQREIDAALNPALFRASGPADPAIGYAAALRIAEAASGNPGGMVRPPDAVWPVWSVYDRRVRGTPGGFWSTHVDPATGAVLGRRDISESFVATTRQLHEALLLRAWSGREIVGWIGVILLFSSLSGIYLWWPRGGGFWRAATLVRRRPFIRLNLDLHAVIGIWIAVVMSVVSFSGIAIIFPGWFRPLLGIAEPARREGPPGAEAAARGQRAEAPGRGALEGATQGQVPGAGEAPRTRREPRGPAAEGPRIDADAAVAAALAAAGPGQTVTTLTPPMGPGGWSVSLRPSGSDPEVRVRSQFQIDAATGAVLAERSPRTRSAGEEALAMQRWLHGGALLGWTGRILVFLSGLALPVLFVTGLLAWLARRRSRARIAVQRMAAQAGAGAGAAE
ncbi:PepSY-associated TM helix domain-containing protein [Plastoroseomonas arctica]|uniref:PepSY domain-containing protein n=1 Tax=Plastoroseomonas arctica TaxID=1509237 RepID=A0AAF1K1F0_9PROT|nr:PepSY-associated TM helix domain-containing protein [Plastoroseomonas arctica]MBR0657278.1 PepSY domain-containing protein [Plastoroseomonas arctica]